jgi:hypothetical protein
LSLQLGFDPFDMTRFGGFVIADLIRNPELLDRNRWMPGQARHGRIQALPAAIKRARLNSPKWISTRPSRAGRFR